MSEVTCKFQLAFQLSLFLVIRLLPSLLVMQKLCRPYRTICDRNSEACGWRCKSRCQRNVFARYSCANRIETKFISLLAICGRRGADHKRQNQIPKKRIRRLFPAKPVVDLLQANHSCILVFAAYQRFGTVRWKRPKLIEPHDFGTDKRNQKNSHLC